VEYEKVQVVDIENGNRLETYIIKGEEHSGVICLNGAAARCVQPQDHVIIMAYCEVSKDELEHFHPQIVIVDEQNKII